MDRDGSGEAGFVLDELPGEKKCLAYISKEFIEEVGARRKASLRLSRCLLVMSSRISMCQLILPFIPVLTD